MTLPSPELDVWTAAVRGDRQARADLLEVWLPVVTGWCFRLGGPKVQAEDAAHEVLIVLLTRMDRIEHPERLPAWLFGTTRRVLAHHRRYAWVRRWVSGARPERVDGARDPLSRAAGAQTVARVRQLLERLSAKDREVIVLADVEERTDTEIAALLGIPRNTVKTRLFRARRRLRGLAEEEGVLPSLHLLEGGEP